MTHESGHAFRHAAGRFASGITVVTTQAIEGAYGVTVSSFASLSLNPLLVTVSINRSSVLLGYIRSAGAFAVSVLASDQQQVAEYFAMRERTPQPGGFPTVSTIASRRVRRSLMVVSAGSTALSRTFSPVAIMRFWLAAWPRPVVGPASLWSIGPVDIAR